MKTISRRKFLFKTVPVAGAAVLLGSKLSMPAQPTSQTHFAGTFVGDYNRLACEASMRVAESPGTLYNPLYIHGASGLGKTHILHAIDKKLKLNNPDLRIVSISGEEFMSDCISSIRRGQMEEFRLRYRNNCDVLLLDHVDFLSRGEIIQRELLFTLDYLTKNQKQVVVTSDLLPNEIGEMDSRIRSRLESGLIVSISKPDFRSKKAILGAKAESRGVNLTDDVTNYLSSNSNNSIRELEGNLLKVVMCSDMLSVPIDLDLAKSLIGTKVI